MRKLLSVTMTGVMAMGLCIGFSGCSDETSSTKKDTEKGPGGTTVTTDSKSTKTTGENPPPPKTP